MNHSETEHQNSLSSQLKTAGPGAKVNLEESWKSRLEAEFASERMQRLKKFLVQEKALGKTIFPKGENYFTALNMTSFDQVKVVILGQDPYHGPGQAHGLCFSVPEGISLPPSLVNIYKELQTDLGLMPASSGNLLPWARQGVLLLNSVLTVEAGKAGAHQGRGWEEFTDKIIQLLNAEREHLVFVLWGSYAQKKAAFVDRNKHLVIESPHPSPLSSYRGFFGSKPFSRINTWLASKGQAPIDWRLQ